MIEAIDVGKCYPVYRHPLHRVIEAVGLKKSLHWDFWALRNIYFTINRGSSFGIVGHNGAGKSTLLKMLSGITHPTEGAIQVGGSIASILELGTGFHHEFSGRNNIYLNCALQGYTREETDRLLPHILEFSELESFIDQPVRTYSTGMYLRLAFAVATAVDPDILIVDEALSVGDEHFRNKCLDRMNEFKAKGKTIVLVSHDLSTVRHFCSQVALLDQGKIIALGKPDEVLDHYLEMVHNQSSTQRPLLSPAYGQPRWGSHEIEVNEIMMYKENGTSSSLFDTGDRVVIDADFQVHAPVQGVVFGYQIYRSDGTYVHGSNHFWHLQKQAYDFLNPGESRRIRCVIPKLPLLPGQYYLTMCCYNQFDGFPQAVDHWERAYIFTISERMNDQHGIFAMDTEWSLLNVK